MEAQFSLVLQFKLSLFSRRSAAGFWPIQKHARKSQGVCSKPAGCQEKMKDRRHEPERLLKFTAFLQHGTAPQSGSLRLCRLHLYFRHGWLFSQNSWDCIWWTTTCNKAEYVMCLFSEYKLCIAVIICLFNPTLKNKQTNKLNQSREFCANQAIPNKAAAPINLQWVID